MNQTYIRTPYVFTVDNHGILIGWYLEDGALVTCAIDRYLGGNLMIGVRKTSPDGNHVTVTDFEKVKEMLVNEVPEHPRVAPERTTGLWTRVSNMVKRTLK